MSSATLSTAGHRAVMVELKDEGKVLRMMNAQANADRRQGNVSRLSAAPRVLRRSIGGTSSNA